MILIYFPGAHGTRFLLQDRYDEKLDVLHMDIPAVSDTAYRILKQRLDGVRGPPLVTLLDPVYVPGNTLLKR